MTRSVEPQPEALAAALADGAAIDWAGVESAVADSSRAGLVHQLRVIDALRRQHATASAVPWTTRALTAVFAAGVSLAALKVLIGLAGLPRVLGDPATPAGLRPYAINLVVLGLSGLLLVFGGSRDRRLPLLGGFFVTMAAAFVQPFLPGPAGTSGVLVALLRACAPESFAMLAFWQFAWQFPHPPVSPIGRRLGRVLVGVAGIASVTVFVLRLVGRYVPTAPPAVTALVRWFDRDAPESLYWPLLLALVLLAIVFLLVKARGVGIDSRRRIMWFLGALGAGMLPVCVAVIATPFVPRMADPDVQRRVGLVVYAGVLSIVPTTAFAVGVTRVMNLQFVIRTALQYALARYAIWTAVVAPLGYLALDVWTNRGLTVQQFVEARHPVPLLVLVGLALATLTYRTALQRAVDRWFLQEPATWCPACAEVHGAAIDRCRCGVETQPADLPLVVNGKFRLHRRLGAGSTGVVYLATDLALGRLVALKTLQAMRPELADRLRREARTMAALRHPHLATIFGVEDWRHTPLLVVEYLEGGTLADVVARGALPIADVLQVGLVLADALDGVHAAGVLHRDIKPGNIGFTAAGEPRLLDFGLAAAIDDSRGGGRDPRRGAGAAGPDADAEDMTPSELAAGSHVVGTPLYLSPEALAGEAPGPSFDLWSLHVVLHEAIAGRHPLRGQPVLVVVDAITHVPWPDLQSIRPECPAAVANYLSAALALDPARRPVSAAAARAALRDLRAGIVRA